LQLLQEQTYAEQTAVMVRNMTEVSLELSSRAQLGDCVADFVTHINSGPQHVLGELPAGLNRAMATELHAWRVDGGCSSQAPVTEPPATTTQKAVAAAAVRWWLVCASPDARGSCIRTDRMPILQQAQGA
jgi:hypothetical protein